MKKDTPEKITAYSQLLDRLRSKSETRRLIGLAGAPASGKSTLAAQLCVDLGPSCALVPMDGFHLDNAILEARGDLARKGAPHTFDSAGFFAMVKRLKTGGETIYAPRFDRERENTVNAALELSGDVQTIVLEGNYLLLDAPVWRDLRGFLDLSVFIDVPLAELEERLLARWSELDSAEAQAKIRENDLPNAELVNAKSLKPDIHFSPSITERD